jgi:hypothetical protein
MIYSISCNINSKYIYNILISIIILYEFISDIYHYIKINKLNCIYIIILYSISCTKKLNIYIYIDIRYWLFYYIKTKIYI